MINVNDIWQLIRDVSRKDHAGYLSTNEFNRVLRIAEELLFDYYIWIYDSTARIEAALDPFRVSLSVPYPPGGYTLPGDLRQRLEVGAIWVESSCGSLVTTPYPAPPLNTNEKMLTLSSGVRKPSLTKKVFRHQIIANRMILYPETFTGNIHLEYLRHPVYGSRGYTIDVPSQEEIYSANTSVNLEWPLSEQGNILDIMLFVKGIQVQSGPLIQWIQQKKGLIPTPESVTTAK